MKQKIEQQNLLLIEYSFIFMTLNPQCLSFLWYVFQLACTLGLFRDCYVICLDYFPEKQIT